MENKDTLKEIVWIKTQCKVSNNQWLLTNHRESQRDPLSLEQVLVEVIPEYIMRGPKKGSIMWIKRNFRALLDMVTSMIIFFNSQNMYALLDPRATHSFISCKFISKLSVLKHKLNKGHSMILILY
jgi:hypothetical protein